MTFKQFKNYDKIFQWSSDKQAGAENPKCISKIYAILLGYNTGKEKTKKYFQKGWL